MVGKCQQSMLDEEWMMKAKCRAIDREMFFDKYEEDPILAKTVDETICLQCPVIAECFNHGTTNSEWGVWGGVYLVDGEPSPSKNMHKTKEVWSMILDAVSDG
jgi:hypothetical protein